MVLSLKDNSLYAKGLILFLMAAVTVIIYWSGLHGPFLFDDQSNIIRNPEVQMETLSLESLQSLLKKGLARNRPMAKISLALNYYFYGLNPFAFRVFNIIVHVLAGFLLYLFMQKTLALPVVRDRYDLPGWVPLLTALLWLVHPLQTQSVTYIIQRMTSMAALFYILSFYLYLQGRLASKRWSKILLLGGCLISGLLALGTKEITATLPFFILLYDWYFLQDLDRAYLKKLVPAFLLMLALPLALSWIYIAPYPWRHLPLMAAKYDWTIMERVMTQFRVVVHYLSLFFFPAPSRLHMDYDVAISHGLTDPVSTLACMAVIAGAMGAAIYLARRDRLTSFCILWFFGNLVIESSFIPLDMAAEHRTYLPSMMLMLLVVVTACRLLGNRRFLPAMIGLALVLNMFWTYQRNQVYSDRLTFWQHEAAMSPKRARVQLNYARALLEKGKLQESMQVLTHCIANNPRYEPAYLNLGTAWAKLGHYKEAIVQFRYLLSITPDYTSGLYNMAKALSELGKDDEAADYYRRTIKSDPKFAPAYNNLGGIYARQGRWLEAVNMFSRALEIRPNYPVAQFNLQKAREALVQKGFQVKQ